MGWSFDLNITTCPEIAIFTLGKINNQFFNEGSFAVVGTNGTFPLLDVEDFGRDAELHVLFNPNLTAKA